MYEVIISLDLMSMGVKYPCKSASEAYDLMLDAKNNLSFLNEEFYVKIKDDKNVMHFYIVGDKISKVSHEEYIKRVSKNIDVV